MEELKALFEENQKKNGDLLENLEKMKENSEKQQEKHEKIMKDFIEENSEKAVKCGFLM